MTEEGRYHRQLDILNMQDLQEQTFTIVGAGGIGSITAITMAKMGCRNITVYDDDDVEEHNISNQFYPHDSLGKPKVEALKELIYHMEGFEITTHYEKYKGEEGDSKIVIVGVDSMEARSMIWENMELLDRKVELLLDARMGAEQMSVFAVNVNSEDGRARYKNTLYSDEDAVQLPCTARAIIYNTTGIAGIVCSFIKKHVNHELPEPFRQVMFDYRDYGVLA